MYGHFFTRWVFCIAILPYVLVALPPHPHSQKRLPHQDYRDLLEKYESRYGTRSGSPSTVSVPYSELDLSQAADWTKEELETLYPRLRDERFIEGKFSNFLRRISWLYPDDGCFARAGMVRSLLELWEEIEPSKIFIFGNLQVTTDNSPKGVVSWWYHVAPIVEVDENYYVLDPAIEPKAPLEIETWILKQVEALNAVKLAICSPYTYFPGNSCKKAKAPSDTKVLSDQKRFLQREWNRQIELDRDPNVVLKDSPPWAQELSAVLLALRASQ